MAVDIMTTVAFAAETRAHKCNHQVYKMSFVTQSSQFVLLIKSQSHPQTSSVNESLPPCSTDSDPCWGWDRDWSNI